MVSLYHSFYHICFTCTYTLPWIKERLLFNPNKYEISKQQSRSGNWYRLQFLIAHLNFWLSVHITVNFGNNMMVIRQPTASLFLVVPWCFFRCPGWTDNPYFAGWKWLHRTLATKLGICFRNLHHWKTWSMCRCQYQSWGSLTASITQRYTKHTHVMVFTSSVGLLLRQFGWKLLSRRHWIPLMMLTWWKALVTFRDSKSSLKNSKINIRD